MVAEAEMENWKIGILENCISRVSGDIMVDRWQNRSKKAASAETLWLHQQKQYESFIFSRVSGGTMVESSIFPGISRLSSDVMVAAASD